MLAFRLANPGLPEALRAGELLARLPSPLDKLPFLPAGPQKPRELVAILGDQRLRHWGPVTCVAISPDGKWVVSGGVDRVVHFWDATNGQPGPVLPGHGSGITAIAFARDGQLLAVGNNEGLVRVWHRVDGSAAWKEQVALKGYVNGTLALVWSPDGKTLAMAGLSMPAADKAPVGTIKLWDAVKGTEQTTIEPIISGIVAAAFSPDGKTLALAESGGVKPGFIRLWDVATGMDRAHLYDFPGMIASLTYGADGKTLVAAGWDGTVHVWDVAKETLRKAFKPSERVRFVGLAPDGKTLALAGGGTGS